MEFMIFYVNCGTQLEYYIRFDSNNHDGNDDADDDDRYNRTSNKQYTREMRWNRIQKHITIWFAHAHHTTCG